MSNKKIEKAKDILKTFGLTDHESQVYFFLARTGAQKANSIAKQLKMYKGQVYRNLKSLQSKGMVEVTINAPAHFTAVSFSRVLDAQTRAMHEEANMLEHEGKELSEWIKPSVPIGETQREKLMVIEGRRNISLRVFQMVKESNKEVLIVICGLRPDQNLHAEIDWSMLEEINKDSVKLRILTQETEENFIEFHRLLERAFSKSSWGNVDWRCLDPNSDLQARFLVVDESEALFFLNATNSLSMTRHEEACIWTNCSAMIQMMSMLFNEFWRTSTKVRPINVQA